MVREVKKERVQAIDNGYDWICDSCGEYMNNQPGFDVASGTWRCTSCRALNDVSENNILDLLDMFKKGVTTFITKSLDEPDDDLD